MYGSNTYGQAVFGSAANVVASGTPGTQVPDPPPVVTPPPTGVPARAGINETTLMRLTTINVSTLLGPAAINLTANLP